MKAYVIMANDSVEHVVLDDKSLAIKKQKELQREFEKTRQYNDNSFIFWHIRDVPYTTKKETQT